MGADALGDAHRRALTGLQVTLGDQLLVGGGDNTARDSELGGERATGGQPRSGLQPSLTDRVAKRALELLMEGGPTALHREQHVNWP